MKIIWRPLKPDLPIFILESSNGRITYGHLRMLNGSWNFYPEQLNVSWDLETSDVYKAQTDSVVALREFLAELLGPLPTNYSELRERRTPNDRVDWKDAVQGIVATLSLQAQAGRSSSRKNDHADEPSDRAGHQEAADGKPARRPRRRRTISA